MNDFLFFCCGSFSNLVLMSRHTPFKAHFSDKCPIIMAIEKSRTEHYDSLPTYCIQGWERQERVCWDPLNLCHSVVASPKNWFCTSAYCFTSSAQCVVSLSKPLVGCFVNLCPGVREAALECDAEGADMPDTASHHVHLPGPLHCAPVCLARPGTHGVNFPPRKRFWT